MGKLTGKVAVITGGTSGIGHAAVRLFIQEGSRVVIADIQDDKGKRLAEELGASAAYVHADVSREADVKAAVDHAVQKFGRLDCLFNNAGSPGVGGPIEAIPADRYDSAMAVLLRGVFLGIKHAAPIMKRQGSGSIISTASVAGLQAGHGPHVYSAAKAAVIHLTRSVAMELGESGVRVNCICPGGIATPIFGKGFGLSDEAAEKSVATMQAVLAKIQPIQRAGLPEDIAKAALWLASDDSSFVNGHALVVDGGLTGGRMWSAVEQQRDLLKSALGLSGGGFEK
jgi:NAD(P)-dependent dehydrogenase (short-subunit alcohol dehydrogenase family)